MDEEEYRQQRAKDFEQVARESLDALLTIRRCAADRRGEISGDCTTYEDAFRKLEIACAALQFIEEHAAKTLA